MEGNLVKFTAAVVVFGFLSFVSADVQAQSRAPKPDAQCLVTTTNGIAGEDQVDPGSFGNPQVSVGPFGLWPNGTVLFQPGGAGFVTRDGSLGMKFGWRRGVSGQLKIDGRRLDAVSSALRSEVPSGYSDRGFQATYVIFPTEGCWEVTGSQNR